MIARTLCATICSILSLGPVSIVVSAILSAAPAVAGDSIPEPADSAALGVIRAAPYRDVVQLALAPDRQGLPRIRIALSDLEQTLAIGNGQDARRLATISDSR